MEIIKKWFAKYFSSEQAIALLLTILLSMVAITWMSDILAPLFISLVIAYLLQGVINQVAKKTTYTIASIAVFSMFIASCIAFLIYFIPTAISEVKHLTEIFPEIINQTKNQLIVLSTQYSFLPDQQSVEELFKSLDDSSASLYKVIVSETIKLLPSALAFIVSLILIPLIIFFLNKDKDQLIGMVSALYPKKKEKLIIIANEINDQLGNYIRGKALQMLIVIVLNYALFKFLHMPDSFLLAFGLGLSVFIPYVGATIATIPVLLVGYNTFGLTQEFWVMILGFSFVQGFDANVVVPLIFSEAVSIHPLLIILAIVVFGGLGGVMGVFFSIPLASVVKALWNHWPANDETKAVE